MLAKLAAVCLSGRETLPQTSSAESRPEGGGAWDRAWPVPTPHACCDRQQHVCCTSLDAEAPHASLATPGPTHMRGCSSRAPAAAPYVPVLLMPGCPRACLIRCAQVKVQTVPGFAKGMSDGFPKFVQMEGVGG